MTTTVWPSSSGSRWVDTAVVVVVMIPPVRVVCGNHTRKSRRPFQGGMKVAASALSDTIVVKKKGVPDWWGRRRQRKKTFAIVRFGRDCGVMIFHNGVVAERRDDARVVDSREPRQSREVQMIVVPV